MDLNVHAAPWVAPPELLGTACLTREGWQPHSGDDEGAALPREPLQLHAGSSGRLTPPLPPPASPGVSHGLLQSTAGDGCSPLRALLSSLALDGGSGAEGRENVHPRGGAATDGKPACATAEATEVCRFFLLGGCTRPDCPFTHSLRVEAPAGVDASKGFFLCANVANMRMSPPKPKQQQQPAQQATQQQQQQGLLEAHVAALNVQAPEFVPQFHQQQHIQQQPLGWVDASSTSDAADDPHVREGAGSQDCCWASPNHAPLHRAMPFEEHGARSPLSHDRFAAAPQFCRPHHYRHHPHRHHPHQQPRRPSYAEGVQQWAPQQMQPRFAGRGRAGGDADDEGAAWDGGWASYRRQQAMRPPLQCRLRCDDAAVAADGAPRVSERRRPPLVTDCMPGSGELDASHAQQPIHERVAAPLSSAEVHRRLRNAGNVY